MGTDISGTKWLVIEAALVWIATRNAELTAKTHSEITDPNRLLVFFLPEHLNKPESYNAPWLELRDAISKGFIQALGERNAQGEASLKSANNLLAKVDDRQRFHLVATELPLIKGDIWTDVTVFKQDLLDVFPASGGMQVPLAGKDRKFQSALRGLRALATEKAIGSMSEKARWAALTDWLHAHHLDVPKITVLKQAWKQFKADQK